MSDQTDKLINLLTPYGLTKDEARIYLVLSAIGVMSALQIARELKLGRTKVYRILDKLIEKGLVVNQYNEAGFKFRAEPLERLELLVKLEYARLRTLQENLPRIVEGVAKVIGHEGVKTRIDYYRGRRGLSQVNYHVLEARGELLTYELATANAFLPQDEADTMRREMVKNRIYTRTITNAIKIEPFTQVREMVRDWWQIRYIPPEKFNVKAEVLLYNDVYCLYRYTDDDIFCVEIYNQTVVDMQRQLFELVWQQARPLTILNDRGEAML